MKRQINFSNSILLILFSVLIISCNQKKCCDGKHIVSNTDCCYLVDTTIDKAVTGFARETVGSISGEVDCADIATTVFLHLPVLFIILGMMMDIQ